MSWSFMTGGPEQGRTLRYVAVLLMGWVVILSLAAAAYFLTPRTYDSGFTLILPGAGSQASVNLESLGQTTSSSPSPFGGSSLSPTENYKRLFQSYRLRGEVAERMGLTMAEVAPPKIKLANQTKLMYLSVRSADPVTAKRLAETWLEAFEDELHQLRKEEQTLREQAYLRTLEGFEAEVEKARARIIAFQSEYGLISIEQFQELVALTDLLRQDLERADTEMRIAQSEIGRLTELLDLSPEQAADVMTLLSDGTFQSLVDARSDAETRRAELSNMLGPNHPDMMAASEESAGVRSALTERGIALLGFEGFVSLDEVYYTSSDGRSALISSLVEASVKLSGARQRRRSVAEQLQRTQERVARLSVPATELDALLRDHQIAETVFASALARMDTSRTDFFASYPLTQTVEAPALPSEPATPSRKFIALGAFAGLFLFAIGLALLWIRLPVIRVLLKTL